MTNYAKTPVSVLIIVKGRRRHLEYVVSGLEQVSSDTSRVDEVIVAHMNEPVYGIDSTLKIKHISISSKRPLPLAAARNAATKVAKNDTLLFLDVDCIPSKTLFYTILQDYDGSNIVMADPLYLAHEPDSVDETLLRRDASMNPARKDIRYGYSDNYELFWSLGFMVSKRVFERIGGFDESFVGYGGEDTDFAFMAKQKAVRLFYSKTNVFHQPHPENDPPLNWFEDIITNSNAFYKKWGIWPMEGWLTSFADSGLIARTEDTIKVLRQPTQQEISQSMK